MADDDNSQDKIPLDDSENGKSEKMFTLKKWNAVAMWSWDVECDICAICRVQVMVNESKGEGLIQKIIDLLLGYQLLEVLLTMKVQDQVKSLKNMAEVFTHFKLWDRSKIE